MPSSPSAHFRREISGLPHGHQDADPGAAMCSYNRINGDYACENPYTLHDTLKREWGFKGFVFQIGAARIARKRPLQRDSIRSSRWRNTLARS